MKNVYEVLRQKEMELTRLEKEVEALRLVAPLLSEEKELNSDMVKPALATAVNAGPQQPIRIPGPRWWQRRNRCALPDGMIPPSAGRRFSHLASAARAALCSNRAVRFRTELRGRVCFSPPP